MDRRGERSSGELNQQSPASQFLQMAGEEEALPVFRRSSMAPSIPVIQPSNRTELYTTELLASPPMAYGPVRTPLCRPDPTRMGNTVVAPEPPPTSHASPTQDGDIVFVLFTTHKGRGQVSDQRRITMRCHPEFFGWMSLCKHATYWHGQLSVNYKDKSDN